MKLKILSYLISISLIPGLIACSSPQSEEGALEVSGAVIDVHTHLMSQALTDGLTGGGVPASTADDLIAQLDEANIQKAIVHSLGYWGLPNDSNMAPENDFVAAEVAKYPDRLIGFIGINPLYESAISEIDRGLDMLGMVGIKLQLPSSGVDLENEEHVAAVSQVLDKARERNIPVLMHVSGPPLDSQAAMNVFGLLGSHPDVRLVIAHCGGELDWELEAYLVGTQTVPQMINNENFYLDLSAHLDLYKDAPLSKRELIVWRLRKWGLERVLFGSDYLQLAPAETPKEALETLSKYPFTQEEIDLITSNNALTWLEGQ
ncbi:amidohydrolase family protein [Chloroflexota bacterium]